MRTVLTGLGAARPAGDRLVFPDEFAAQHGETLRGFLRASRRQNRRSRPTMRSGKTQAADAGGERHQIPQPARHLPPGIPQHVGPQDALTAPASSRCSHASAARGAGRQGTTLATGTFWTGYAGLNRPETACRTPAALRRLRAAAAAVVGTRTLVLHSDVLPTPAAVWGTAVGACRQRGCGATSARRWRGSRRAS